MTTQVLRSRRQYAIDTLAGDITAARRATIEANLAAIEARLGVRCECCGRRLEAAVSVARAVGPVCAHKAAA